MNDNIKCSEVRLIDEQGTQLGITPTDEAMRQAQGAGRDLVLVAPDAKPPVARIMDYGKFKYEQKKRQHTVHRRQSQLKELRLRPKTDSHDVEVRIAQARKFLTRGDKVLVNMLFRGREMAFTRHGMETLQQFAEELSDIAKVERQPSMDHQRMGMILVPK